MQQPFILTGFWNLLLSRNNFLKVLIFSFITLWFLMFFYCIDKKDWFIENILVFIFFIYVLTSPVKWKFSNTSYFLIFLFLLLHIYGAMYAYTKNPIGEYVQELYTLSRNPYDRVVHFSFGFLLAYPIWEYVCKKISSKEKGQFILPVLLIICLATFFELIEWAVAAVTTKETGETYVATQGDVWDAHKDIVLAILGAFITITFIYYRQKFKTKNR